MTYHIKTKVFSSPPLNFNPSFEVVGCFCRYQDQILLLKRHPNSPHGGTWGIPAGKINPLELPKKAIVREVFEEIGLRIDSSTTQIGVFYLRNQAIENQIIDYPFYLFESLFNDIPLLNLALEENIEAKWSTIEEAFQLQLIDGAKEILDFYGGFIG